MGIYAEVIGNLTSDPSSKTITVKGESRTITEIRIFADVYRRDGDNLVQDDDKSTGVNVTIWNERQAGAVVEHLRKGARVRAEGDLFLEQWRDRESGAPRAGLRMDAESVTLVLTRVEKIEFRAKASREQAEPADA